MANPPVPFVKRAAHDEPPDTPATISQKRRARVWSGRVAAFGAVGAVLGAAVAPSLGVGLLAGTWLASAVVGRYLRTQPRVPRSDAVELIEAAASGPKSISAMVSGLSLLTPLSLHLGVFGTLVALYGGWEGALGSFASWMIATSVMLVPTYATLLGLAHDHGRNLTYQRERSASRSAGGRALLMATSAALVPGIIFGGLPSLFVLMTGALFLPGLYGWGRATLESEEQQLGLTRAAVSAQLTAGGGQALLALARSAAMPVAERTEAMRLLAGHPDPETARGWLEDLMREGQVPVEMISVGLRLAHQHDLSLPPELLLELMAHGRMQVGEDAVRLLLRHHRDAAEDVLVRGLDSGKYPVQVAALQGLASIGGRSSALTIRAHAQRWPFFPEVEARRALENIRDRLAEKHPTGALALAELNPR